MVHCSGPTQIVEVINPTTNKIWMDRNLGASQVATSATDANAYGDLYQWGRFGDGHQCRNSGTTTTLSSTNTPVNSSYIIASASPNDWRTPQNNNLWQGEAGVNNPCPPNYRLPTDAEWTAERNTWSGNNTSGAFASRLKLTAAGYRGNSINGALNTVGWEGLYWSSTISGTQSLYLRFGYTGMLGGVRADGFSVRCIKN